MNHATVPMLTDTLSEPPVSPAPADADRARLHELLRHIHDRNPFERQQVAVGDSDLIDVTTIHAAVFDRICTLARLAHEDNRAIAVTLFGEVGSGKSHLLARLQRHFTHHGSAVFVQFNEKQGPPSTLAQRLLRSLIGSLTWSKTNAWHDTPLYRYLETLMGAEPEANSADEVETRCATALARLARRMQPSFARHAVYRLLTLFLRAAWCVKAAHTHDAARDASTDQTHDAAPDAPTGQPHDASRPQIDAQTKQMLNALRAEIAVRRLEGDGLDRDSASVLGYRGPELVSGLPAIDAEMALQTWMILAQVLHAVGQPIVLAVDQVHNLERPQILAVARLLHEIKDRVRNVLIVLSEAQNELTSLIQTQAIPWATWERLGENKLELMRLQHSEGRQLLEAQLEAFFRDFETIPALAEQWREDTLYPLGREWLRHVFDGHPEGLRPRRLLQLAADRWRQVQAHLVAAMRSAPAANSSHPVQSPPPNPTPKVKPTPTPTDTSRSNDVTASNDTSGKGTPPLPLEQRFYERWQTIRSHRDSYPANVSHLCGMTKQLLRRLMELQIINGLVAVETSPEMGNQILDLLLTYRRGASRSPVTSETLGLKFVQTSSPTSTAAILRNLKNLMNPPTRMVLITDERQPLPLGQQVDSQARQRLQELRQRPHYAFQTLELTFDEVAELQALYDVLFATNAPAAIPVETLRHLFDNDICRRHRLLALCRGESSGLTV